MGAPARPQPLQSQPGERQAEAHGALLASVRAASRDPGAEHYAELARQREVSQDLARRPEQAQSPEEA